MTTERDSRTRIVLSWLREDAHENPERMLLRALDEVDTTPQRRSSWPAWRFSDVNNVAKVLVATAAVVAFAVVGINLLPGSPSGAAGSPPPASPAAHSVAPPTSPSPRPTPEPTASLVTRVLTPFGPDGSDDEDPRAASITFTFDAPASWQPIEGREQLGAGIDDNGPSNEAYLEFYRVVGLYSDPCLTEEEDKVDAGLIPVGPTVDDLVTALVDHPSLDVTSPVDVTLAGVSGKYLDLRVPKDISACFVYKPMLGNIYAQGPGQRWHMWVLDVGGVRVLVETQDYAGTSAERLAEEQAIIDSLEIKP
jgi:hypothetical protein